MPDTTKNLFDSTQNQVDYWSQDVALRVDKTLHGEGRPDPVADTIAHIAPPIPIPIFVITGVVATVVAAKSTPPDIKLEDVRLGAQCTVTAASASYIEAQQPHGVKDAFLIGNFCRIFGRSHR